jgi:hypothetical protein
MKAPTQIAGNESVEFATKGIPAPKAIDHDWRSPGPALESRRVIPKDGSFEVFYRGVPMHKRRFITAVLAVVLTVLAVTPTAMAVGRTWVSGVGDDVNPCSRTAPCKTFAGAISKTDAKGEINVIDAGAYGAVTITKAMTISGRGSQAGILASGVNGIVVNAGANDRVTIRNLDINGFGTGLAGIKFIAGKSLVVANTQIFGFLNPGIWMVGAGRLSVRNSEVDDSAYGIAAGPPSGTVRGSIINSVVDHNGYGIYSGAASRLSVIGSQASDNSTAGFAARFGGTLNVRSCLVEGNATGLLADNSGKMRVSSTTVTDNVLGLSYLTGGQLISRLDNTVEDNDTNGTFSSTYSPK